MSNISLSSALTAISNHFKPYRAEAILRLRINTFCFLATVVLSYLLPVPGIFNAVRVVLKESHHEQWTMEWLVLWVCRFEIAIAGIFGFNVLQSIYAIRYPRAPFSPIQSPAHSKKRTPASAPVTPKRTFKLPVSPSTTPLPQKAFAFSPSASTSLGMSTSSTYPASPVSTPSRVLQYSVLSPSPNTSTSTAGVLATPSPIISAYKGKHSSSIGRGLDSSLLGMLAKENDDE
ncbi:hypothetical protein BDQ17DRAFT_314527 [Cyathus striatus]|nr:hypothetical protein BDQ17DRAFT_314527 [Cyathus striatus]